MNIGNCVVETRVLSGFLERQGSKDFAVDGTSPKEFVLEIPNIDAGQVAIKAIKFCLGFKGKMKGAEGFADMNALTNGIDLGLVQRNGATVDTLEGDIKTNGDILSYDPQANYLEHKSNEYTLSFQLASDLPLVIPCSKYSAVVLKVQDDLSDMELCQCYVSAFQVTPKK